MTEMMMSAPKPTRIIVSQELINHYTIRLHRDITEPDDFDEEFLLLASCTPTDTVTFDISTCGGQVDTAVLLMRAIQECPAFTKAKIGVECSSAGSAIALACDAWDIDEHSSFMVHTATFGAFGSAPALEAQVAHRLKMVRRFVKNTYTGFLTEEEVERVLDGKEFWCEGEELMQRLERHAEYQQQKLDNIGEGA